MEPMSLLVPASPSFGKVLLFHIPTKGMNLRTKRPSSKVLVSRWDGGHDRDHLEGNSVDEGMIVLRKRIHEMKVIEGKQEVSSRWVGWEKEYYCGRYSSDVCEALALLQSLLMSTRPSVALGILALILGSITSSSVFFLYHFVDQLAK